MIRARFKSVVRFCWNQYSLWVCIWNLNVVLSSSRICYFWSTWKKNPSDDFSRLSLICVFVEVHETHGGGHVHPNGCSSLNPKNLEARRSCFILLLSLLRWTYAKQSWVVRWSAQMYFSRRRPPKICDQWSLDIVREGDSHKWTWGSGLGVDCHWMMLHVLNR